MSIQSMSRHLVEQFLRKRGYSLAQTPDLGHFLASRLIDVVLDVGANVGQFAINLRENGFEGRIVSFEPIKAVHALLAQAAANDPLWETRNYALGVENGTTQIHVSRYSVFSSILEQTREATGLSKDADVVYVEDITVHALDDFFEAEFGTQRVFLKIDVQGFEPLVLQGAARSLARIQGVQLELPVVHLYQNTWSIEAGIARMRECGFVVAQVRPLNVLSDDASSIVEIDCIFRRAD